jgi:Asp-tRNA(Asn)/Glu-tRNA(Gln) amidotransferase A subunit family amidase
MGLTSRAGVFPLNMRADVAGPLARTLEDAVKVFQAIVGEDPRDPATAAAKDHVIPDYSKSLQRDGLKGAVIGVLHEAYDRNSADAEIVRIFQTGLEDLRRQGATVVDPAKVEGLEGVRRPGGGGQCMGFKFDMNQFLADRSGQVPMADLTAILRSGRFHPSVQKRLEDAEKGPANGPDSPACQADAAYRQQFGEAVVKTMDRLKLDAFVYPTWSNPPRLIGDLNTPAGDNSQVYSPTSGFPAINIPMGYSRGATLPVGMTFYGRAWSEEQLIKLAFAYEQATKHRRPPASTPPLR